MGTAGIGSDHNIKSPPQCLARMEWQLLLSSTNAHQNLFFSSFYYLAVPLSVWDLSSLTQDQNQGFLQWNCRVLTIRLPGESCPSKPFQRWS